MVKELRAVVVPTATHRTAVVRAYRLLLIVVGRRDA
jgi:hypothetical protein